MPDESKEEAQERRAKQAEKRRLAAIKADEDKAKRASRKRLPSNGDAAADDNEKDGDDDKFESASKKRARTAVPAARKKAVSAAKKVPEKRRVEEEDEADDEKVENEAEQEEEQEQEEIDEVSDKEEESVAVVKKGTEPEGRKPTAREKRAAATPPTRTLPARKTQTVKHQPKPKSTTVPAQTPTRPRASPAGSKPPFGSPMPPKAQALHVSRQKATVVSNVDPPTGNNQTKNNTCPAPTVPRPSAAPRDPPVNANTTTRSSNDAHHGVKLDPIVVSDPTASIAMPKMRDLTELYAELERLDQEEEDADYDSEDDSDASDEDDGDQELRLQALQVIAERRDRERIQQMQQQAAEATRLQDERDMLARQQRAQYKWPFLTVLTVTVLYWWYPEQCREVLFGPRPVFNVHTCFMDSKVAPHIDMKVEEDPICANPDAAIDSYDPPLTIEYAACPTDAFCRGGRLMECPPLHSIHNVSCYLSAESNETLAAIQQLVHEWTLCSYCSIDGSNLEETIIANNWTDRPFFSFHRVMEKLGLQEGPLYKVQLLEWGNASAENAPRFVVENDWVALHPGVKLKIPFTCQFGRFVFGVLMLATTVLSIVVAFLWGVTKQLSWVYYRALLASPAYVGLASVVLAGLSISLYRRYLDRVNRSERNLAIVNARHKVYECLQEQDGVELSSTWLSQDLAWKMYEMSSSGRRRFMKHTWPCVIRDIAEDSRVIKTVRTEQGKRVEYWKWVAPTMSSSAMNGNGNHKRVVRFDQ